MVNNNWSSLKKHYIGLDLFRVVSVLTVCAFHTTIHLGADYGPLQAISLMGAVFMTAFFMLSGFSIFVNYAETNLMNIARFKVFVLKRIIAIMPMYYIVSLIYIIAYHHSIEELKISLILLPIELLCIQSNFSTLFNISHNGGTWFISCIMMCYLIYPMIQEILKQLPKKAKIILIVFCVGICLYSPMIVKWFGISNIYSTPFFRILEFTIGALLAALKLDFDKKSFINKYIYNWGAIIAAACVMSIGITFSVQHDLAVGDYMLYNLICLPCFIVLLLGLSGVDIKILKNSKVLKYFVSISYVFFLAQLFSNKVSKWIIIKYAISSNIAIILVGWVSCIIIAIVLHEIFERPITNYLKFKYIK